MAIETWIDSSGLFGMGAGPVSPISNAALNAGGAGSGFIGPLGPLGIIGQFGSFIGGRIDAADARRAAADAARAAAVAEMAAQGKDPRVEFSPENLAETMTDWSWADNTGLTLEDISQQLIDQAVNNFIANPTKPATVSEQATDATGGKTPDNYSEIPASQAPPQDAVEGVFQDTAGATWGYDVQGNKWKIADAPEGGSNNSVDTTIVTGDPSLLGGDIPDAPEKPVEGSTVVTNANAKNREGSTIIWTHRNPDGSVVASDPMGEVWQVSPPTEPQQPVAVVPTLTASTGTTPDAGDMTGPVQGTSTGTGPGTGTVGTDTGTATGTITADVGTTPDSPVMVGPVPATNTTPDPGNTTGIGPGTGTGTGPGTEGGNGGMFGLGATETTQMVFPELYKLSDTPYTLVGNLLSRPNRGLFS